uniref:Lipase-like C-terminal domain-containing protein n=1 Tax=Guillardia theta TaxID=55529 RepID=A0A6U5ZYI0_GUITH|mmetsp:Transcript_2967/g.10002  ORF Transcript_2967/g.10002 Transcript_2967/m.10002 type:complete len:457 (+) Transcript_2967:31-1401(+)
MSPITGDTRESWMIKERTREAQAVFVILDGLFGGGISRDVRRYLRSKLGGCRFLSVKCGHVSSVHDRAVECFYALKGGRVDYNAGGYALEEGHGRYGGRDMAGLYPEWSEERPIHILAYSLGAPTARYLQYLLARSELTDGRGGRHVTSGRWIRSICTLNGVNNGTSAVFAVGLSPSSLRPLPASILWWIFSLIYFLVWCDHDPENECLGLRLRHWNVRREQGVSLLRLLFLWRPGGQDNGGRDLSPQRMRELNDKMKAVLPCSETRYLACFSSSTQQWRMLGRLQLPTVKLLRHLPFALFLLPLSLFVSFLAFVRRISSCSSEATRRAKHEKVHVKSVGGGEEEQEEDKTGTLRTGSVACNACCSARSSCSICTAAEEEEEANDGLVAVAGQLPPRTEPVVATYSCICKLEGAGRRLQGGGWTSVRVCHRDHIDMTEDGEWQRRWLEKLCMLIAA